MTPPKKMPPKTKRPKTNLTKKSSSRKTSTEDDKALKLVMRMMALRGPSTQETKVVEFVRRQLIRAGADESAIVNDDAPKRSPRGGEIGNLIFKLPGTVRGPRRMMVAHLDTVPICVGCQPTVRGRRVYSADPSTGLGADDRAGASILLLTAMELLRKKPEHPPLTFLWPVQEEGGLHGARYVKKGLLGKPRFAFNFDGGSPNKLTIGATGGYRMDIEITGIAAHAGNAPQQGVSAIAIASLAIADLTQNGWHGLVTKRAGVGTSNVGVFEGGAATNVVCDRVMLHTEARSHDPKFRERIVSEIKKAFKKAVRSLPASDGRRGKVEFTGRLDYESFKLPKEEPAIEIASAAVRAEGAEPELAIANGGLDANWLTEHGIPTVSLGCGQLNIHTVKEELDIPMFHHARRIAIRLATGNSAQDSK